MDTKSISEFIPVGTPIVIYDKLDQQSVVKFMGIGQDFAEDREGNFVGYTAVCYLAPDGKLGMIHYDLCRLHRP